MITDILLGSDLVNCDRLKSSFNQFGESFFTKLLTSHEINYCLEGQSWDKLPENFFKKAAGRIAVKESLSKALGCGLNGLGYSNGINWQDIEVISTKHQPPQVKLTGLALEKANQQNIKQWKLTISHDGQYAMANILGLQFSL